MRIGIFSKTFVRPTLDGVLNAVREHGMADVQFNLSCAGLPSMPEALDADTARQIAAAFARHGVRMAALSGTFNMIHPDPAVREDGLARLEVLAAACATLGTNVVTLCTGTRDPHNMWRRHLDNDSPAAWDDLLATMRRAVASAERHGVVLGVEPEVANVIDSARKARRLLDEMGSPHVKIIMDGANVFHAGELAHQRAVLDETFDLLGSDIVLAHAKDVDRDGEAGHLAAGTGVLDYDYYLEKLHAAGYRGPLILHSLDEEQVDAATAFLRARLAQVSAAQE